MIKVDKRKKYYMVVDVETAGNFSAPQVYDFGFAVCDKKGNIVEEKSFVISEVFDNKRLMDTAYYAKKLPMYYEGLETGKFVKTDLMTARTVFLEMMEKYDIKTICAYNLMFDMKALKSTMNSLGYGTKFLPVENRYHKENIDLLCIWSFACEVLFTQKTYSKIAVAQGWVSPAGNMKTNAECAYRYITRMFDFEEEHTGLADVQIECQILAKCISQKQKHNSGIIAHPWRIPNKKQ